jgi:hypothetical protein
MSSGPWIIGLLLIVLMLSMIVYEYQRKQARSVEDYEREVAKPDLVATLVQVGMLDLEKKLKPNLPAAIEILEEDREGRLKQQQNGEVVPVIPSSSSSSEGKSPIATRN